MQGGTYLVRVTYVANEIPRGIGEALSRYQTMEPRVRSINLDFEHKTVRVAVLIDATNPAHALLKAIRGIESATIPVNPNVVRTITKAIITLVPPTKSHYGQEEAPAG